MDDERLRLTADESDSIRRMLDTLDLEIERGTGMTAVWRGMRSELRSLLRDGCPQARESASQ